MSKRVHYYTPMEPTPMAAPPFSGWPAKAWGLAEIRYGEYDTPYKALPVFTLCLMRISAPYSAHEVDGLTIYDHQAGVYFHRPISQSMFDTPSEYEAALTRWVEITGHKTHAESEMFLQKAQKWILLEQKRAKSFKKKQNDHQKDPTEWVALFANELGTLAELAVKREGGTPVEEWINQVSRLLVLAENCLDSINKETEERK